MMKSIIGILLAIAVLGGAVYLLTGMSDDFEIVIIDEVAELETQLAALDAQVRAETLTPEGAAVARADILSKLATIEANAAGAGAAQLTEAQKQQLAAGLNRLKNVLIRYQDTLVAVDDSARKARGTVIRNNDRSLQSVFIEVIAETEAAADEAEAEVIIDTSLEAELSELESEAPDTIEEVIEVVEATKETEAGSDTDEAGTTRDDGTNEEIPADDTGADVSETDSETATGTKDTVVEGEAELEIEAETTNQ